MSGYETGIAAEFYILSCLQRLPGISAALTLANKKAVDIIVSHDLNHSITVDVKGAAGITGFFVNNVNKKSKNHFIVFVSFLGKFEDPTIIPEVYIVPSLDIEELSNFYRKSQNRVVRLKKLRELRDMYFQRWDYFQKL